MIISLHLPKTGGGSFHNLLQSYYENSFSNDYADIPINKTLRQRTKDAIEFDKNFTLIKRLEYRVKGIKCIHGHFLPYKYQKIFKNKNIYFITWLRDPIERVISHYYYWQRTYNENSAPLHKKVVEESWDLEKFCFSVEMKNLYDQFLWNFPINNFDFIGITEHYDEDLIFFTKKYLKDYQFKEIPKLNTNPNSKGQYSDEISFDFLSKLKSIHSKDYEIYNYALEKRKLRIK